MVISVNIEMVIFVNMVDTRVGLGAADSDVGGNLHRKKWVTYVCRRPIFFGNFAGDHGGILTKKLCFPFFRHMC
jgi:hypothetical protein